MSDNFQAEAASFRTGVACSQTDTHNLPPIKKTLREKLQTLHYIILDATDVINYVSDHGIPEKKNANLPTLPF